MNTLRRLASRGVLSFLALLLSFSAPLPVLADGGSGQDTTSQSAPVATPDNGISKPTGSASGTYTYNASTGLWENDYYTWDPATKQTTPKSPLEYTYNDATGMWDTPVWQFSAADGAYHQVTVSVPAPPDGAITHGGPATSSTPPASDSTNAPSDGSTSSTADNVNPSSPQSPVPQTQATPDNQGGSSATANLSFSTAGTLTNFGTSTANSGAVVLQSNTAAGNVSSGNATAVANYLNMLQSQSALTGANVATFTANIQGDVSGDFVIDPATLMQPASAPSQNLGDLKITTANSGNIVNNVNLAANSGNASADSNTSAGDVASGSANAIADVVNMINSVVAANQSFLGVINIEGNYTGNILVPTDSLNALLGSSASDPGADNGLPAVSTVNNTSDQNIANNVNLAAASGNVTGSENTQTGNLSSGNGLTNLTILNLTGRNVVAANSLLVFVNVLGSWVGLIMDAPTGTTSAALGGGVTSDTALPSLTSNISNSDKNSITNNITASAKSGDASATKNTSVGNVTSGNASASANIANLIGSNFSLSNWFGVLFINVLGTWHGNFGTVKPPVVPAITSGVSNPAGGAPAQPVKVFQFVHRNPSGQTTSSGSGGVSGGSDSNLALSPLSQANQSGMSSSDLVKAVSSVLGASSPQQGGKNSSQAATENTSNLTLSIVAIAVGASGLLYVSIERVRTNMRNRRLVQK